MTCEATSGPALHLVPHLPNRHCQGRDGMSPHRPDRTMQWAGNLGGGARTEAPPDTTSHIFIQQMDGYGDTRTDNSQVSINKRHGTAVGLCLHSPT